MSPCFFTCHLRFWVGFWLSYSLWSITSSGCSVFSLACHFWGLVHSSPISLLSPGSLGGTVPLWEEPMWKTLNTMHVIRYTFTSETCDIVIWYTVAPSYPWFCFPGIRLPKVPCNRVFWKRPQGPAWWLTPVIPATRRLKHENRLILGGRGYSELRSCHCTTSLRDRVRLCLKKRKNTMSISF